MKKSIVFLIFSFLTVITISAQEMTKSVTQAISKAASKGELFDYFINIEENRIELAYKLKETTKKLVMETYYFKLDDLSFISSKEEEFQKEKVRYKRVRGVKDKDPIKLLKVSRNNINGKLKLHKGHITSEYRGRIRIDNFIEETTKEVYTSQGDKFIYMHHKIEQPNLDITGEFAVFGHISVGVGNATILGMEKSKPYYSKYAMTIYDAHTLEEKLYKSFDLGYSYVPLSIKFLPNGDVGMIFKSYIGVLKTKTQKEKFKLNPARDFRYVQLNTKGEKVVDVSFMSEFDKKKGGSYNLQIIQGDEKGDIIILGLFNRDIYGPGGPGTVSPSPKYVVISNFGDGLGHIKPTHAMVLKISEGKVAFKKEMELDEFLTNVRATSGTKTPKIPLKNYTTFNVTTDKEGNVLIGGMSKVHSIFQIDNDGTVTTYLDASDQDLTVYNYFIKNSMSEIFWVNTDQSKVKSDATSADIAKIENKRTAVISHINSTGKKIEKTISLTPDGIFIDRDEPITMISKDEMLILGHGKKKEIYLSKILLK